MSDLTSGDFSTATYRGPPVANSSTSSKLGSLGSATVRKVPDNTTQKALNLMQGILKAITGAIDRHIERSGEAGLVVLRSAVPGFLRSQESSDKHRQDGSPAHNIRVCVLSPCRAVLEAGAGIAKAVSGPNSAVAEAMTKLAERLLPSTKRQ